MTFSKNGTAARKGRGKVNTKKGAARKAGIFLLPVLTAAPLIAAFIWLASRFGPTIHKLLNILIKMAVTS